MTAPATARAESPTSAATMLIPPELFVRARAPAAGASERNAVGGVEEHLLELARQVAAPHQGCRGGQGATVDAGPDHVGVPSRRIWLRRFGPVSDGMLRAGQDCGRPAGGGGEGEDH